ncbi:ATP-binding protein [Methyloversatilis thermotolerans]|uniref:ATP-binding protein n=1 Tax=Methyloversatilis thermotolerans TaxID=1346290 RepID=UPI00037C6C8D|nr:ATP-binding protein [Methyloversatilis thermotolerans]
MTLKNRLLLLVLLLMCVLLATHGYLHYRAWQSDSVEEIESGTRLALMLLPEDMPLTAGDGRSVMLESLLERVRRMKDIRHVRIDVLDLAGRVLASSDHRGEAAWPAPDEAPVQASGTVRMKPWRLNGEIAGFYRVSPMPSDEMREKWEGFKRLSYLTVAFSVSAALLLYWALSRALAPVQALRTALRQIEAGQLEARLPAFRLPELAELSASFNRMATSLAEVSRERSSLLRKIMVMEEQTRRAIARDLHDEMSTYMVAMQPHVAVLSAACQREPALERYRGSARALGEHLAQLLGRVRVQLESLHPAEIDALGLYNALRQLVEQRSAQAPRPLELVLNLEGESVDAGPAVEASAYRIVQEAVTNAFKHSDCSRLLIGVSVEQGREGRLLKLDIWDDGTAHGIPTGGSGLGMLGMRERALALGGQCTAGPAPGGGWRVTVRLPFARTEQEIAA